MRQKSCTSPGLTTACGALGRLLYSRTASPRGAALSGEVDPNGDLSATGVVSSAGNWCARVIPVGGADQAPIAAEFRTLGCEARETAYGLIVVEPQPQGSGVVQRRS